MLRFIFCTFLTITQSLLYMRTFIHSKIIICSSMIFVFLFTILVSSLSFHASLRVTLFFIHSIFSVYLMRNHFSVTVIKYCPHFHLFVAEVSFSMFFTFGSFDSQKITFLTLWTCPTPGFEVSSQLTHFLMLRFYSEVFLEQNLSLIFLFEFIDFCYFFIHQLFVCSFKILS